MSELLISAFFLILTQLYLVGKMLKIKIPLKNLKKILVVLLLIILTAYLYSVSDSMIRVISIVIFVSIGNYIIFEKEFGKIVLSTFFINITFAISEVFFVMSMFLFENITLENLKNDLFGNVVANILICIITIIIFSIPIIKKGLTHIMSLKFENSRFLLVTFSFLGILISTMSIYSVYYKLSSTGLICVIIVFILIYSFISYKFFFERSEKESAQEKNNILIKNIMEYEKIIETQKVDAHENKNQLRIIKQMVNPKNIKLVEYVEALLKEKSKEDKKLINKVSNIPNGGLRALIYSKLVCLDESYNVTIIVSRKVNVKTLESIDSKTNVQMCQLIGVFLDNAIEAASMTKDKIIAIDLWCDEEKFRITISNTYVGTIEIEKISNPSYTTKGDNHGFGLTLAKRIIEKNSNFKNEKFINNNIFSQVLNIKLK